MVRGERWAWLRDRRFSEQDIVDRGTGVVAELGRDDPLWPGQLATLAGLLLYLALPTALTIGPGRPLPVTGSVVLAALVIAAGGGREAKCAIAIGLVLVATLANLISLSLPIHYLIAGGRARGAELLDGGVLIWTTSLLLFASLYWELDRGGPRDRRRRGLQ